MRAPPPLKGGSAITSAIVTLAVDRSAMGCYLGVVPVHTDQPWR